jgi:hypothetical protein
MVRTLSKALGLSMTNPPKYPRTAHWPWSETIHSDDNTSDCSERFIKTPVIITEKLDGGNTCLFDGQVYARSTDAPASDGWFAMVKKHQVWKTVGNTDYIYYGEGLYGIHSVEYDPLAENSTYFLFAVREAATGVFLSWEEVELHAEELGVLTVPVVFSGEFASVEELTAFLKTERKSPSALGPEKEGFVIRRPNSFHATDFLQNVVKFVRAHHVQTDQHWRRNWQPCRLKGMNDV